MLLTVDRVDRPSAPGSGETLHSLMLRAARCCSPFFLALQLNRPPPSDGSSIYDPPMVLSISLRAFWGKLMDSTTSEHTGPFYCVGECKARLTN